MPGTLWTSLISASAALIGVGLGALLTARVQRRQWARGQQVDACVAIVVESTRLQLSLRGQWKRGERVDWGPWNEALARVSLVGTPPVVDAAGRVDEAFWRHGERFDRGDIPDEAAWFAATVPLEAVRLAFVNTAKEHVLGSADRLDRLPVRRPRGYMPGVPPPDAAHP